MKSRYVRKTVYVSGNPDTIRQHLASSFEAGGLRPSVSENGNLTYYTPFFSSFSSKRPLSCVSKLSAEVIPDGGLIRVEIGASFTKIRYFVIALMLVICVAIPAALSYQFKGVIDIPPPSYLGIPLGFMVHCHVRWRVFYTIRRLIHQAGE